jgi:hypothetical protein
MAAVRSAHVKKTDEVASNGNRPQAIDLWPFFSPTRLCSLSGEYLLMPAVGFQRRPSSSRPSSTETNSTM